MKAELVRLCRGAGIRVEGDSVVVTFATGREHRIEVRETHDAYDLVATVARTDVICGTPKLGGEPLRLHVWRRNRSAQLVGFHLDPPTEHRRRLTARAWVPKPGLTPKEMQHYLRRVASEADRLEYVLTGRDLE